MYVDEVFPVEQAEVTPSVVDHPDLFFAGAYQTQRVETYVRTDKSIIIV